MTFEAPGLHPLILKAFANIHYDKPTPVQTKTIPAAIAGKDLLVSSQTDSGKPPHSCSQHCTASPCGISRKSPEKP